jgi:ABC-type amino acid transport substrate-binding protein
VASDIPYAPFEFFEKPGSRKVVGFDVDIVNAIAAKIGITSVEFVDQGFDSIFISIPQKRFDMAASSITITPEREKNAIFSDPYFAADQSIMVKKGSAIATEADLVGKTLGVQRGTTGAEFAGKVEGATLKRYEEIDDAFIALETGRVDAVINDFAISAYATKQRTDLEVVSEIVTNESYGLMFPKESVELRDAFNKGLTEIRGDGTYAEIYRTWFNTDPPS